MVVVAGMDSVVWELISPVHDSRRPRISTTRAGLPLIRDTTTMTGVASAPAELEIERPAEREHVERDRPWIVVVWNDPVNLMSYVAFVFQKLFGYSREKATKLMLQVHNEGKAVVSSGTREKAEHDVARLHAHGLWATLRQD
jgi:ATP-dependent Clp protease adaptor protein ClpS